jgi:hypothetical protein
MDIDSIPFGVDFRQYIAGAIAECSAMLVIIGEKWPLSATRLNDSKDFVRVEIETALRLGRSIIPVLIGNTQMPKDRELPASLEMISYLNATRIDPGRDFHHHVDRLIQALILLMSSQNQSLIDEPVTLREADEVPLTTVESAPLSPFLEIASGTPEGKKYKLIKDREVIGWRADCDIHIDYDEYLAGYHGQFLKDGKDYRFADLQSKNGSFVNGNRVGYKERVLLKDGDRLHLGQSILIYHTTA